MSAKTGLKTGYSGSGTRERRTGRPGVPLAALFAAVAAAGATWYGFLAQSHGLAAVPLAVPRLQRPAEPVPGGRRGALAGTQADGTRTVTAILGLLSMAAALIHFAVAEQHWAEYWLY